MLYTFPFWQLGMIIGWMSKLHTAEREVSDYPSAIAAECRDMDRPNGKYGSKS
jgi:hypothetical protein